MDLYFRKKETISEANKRSHSVDSRCSASEIQRSASEIQPQRSASQHIPKDIKNQELEQPQAQQATASAPVVAPVTTPASAPVIAPVIAPVVAPVQVQQPEPKQSKKEKKGKKLITSERLDTLRSEMKKEINDVSNIMAQLTNISKVSEDLKTHKESVSVKHNDIDQKMEISKSKIIEIEERLSNIESMIEDA